MASAAPPRQPTIISRPKSLGRQNPPLTSNEQSRAQLKASTPQRTAPLRLKAIIRRLPPGLTEDEFQKALGEEWRIGGEKVEWYAFKAGKVTKDISKPSVPARAYLNLTKQDHLARLSQVVRDADFSDLRNTAGDSSLLGPPFVELATYSRIPTTKPRKDARQGTIDQDSEFMNFLLELTNPITKPTPIDVHAAEKDLAKNASEAVTPLIQFLREKKSNKEKTKDQSTTKGSRQARQDGKEAKTSTNDKSNGAGNKGKSAKDSISSQAAEKKGTSASKSEKPREPIRVLSKQAASAPKTAQTQNSASTKATAAGTAENVQTNTPERKQRKVGVEAKSLLQRDLGLGGGRRKRGEGAAQAASGSSPAKPVARRQSVGAQSTQSATTDAADSVPPTATKPPQPSPASPAKNTTNQSNAKPNKETASVLKANAPTTTSSKASTAGNATQGGSSGTQAFLKHANASQGITDASLQSAMSVFGLVTRVEIDKKKGFAYVDFTTNEALKKAMAASPVTIGQGSVVVLERREKPAKQEKTNKGGNASAQPAAAATGNSPEKPSVTANASSGSPSNSASGSNQRGASNKGHRPRGNRGRGSGRNTAASGGGGSNNGSTEKATTTSSQATTQVSETKT